MLRSLTPLRATPTFGVTGYKLLNLVGIMNHYLSYLSVLLAIALTSCTADSLPANPVDPDPHTGTEKVSINVRLADPATRAVIHDSGSGQLPSPGRTAMQLVL